MIGIIKILKTTGKFVFVFAGGYLTGKAINTIVVQKQIDQCKNETRRAQDIAEKALKSGEYWKERATAKES